MIHREPVTEQAAQHLAHAIVAGRLRPGERIPEQPWAAELGVSRGSLRESLLILERRHLVRIEPRRGARVAPLDLAWAEDIAEAWFLLLRAVVERVAVERSDSTARRLAAARARMGALDSVGDRAGFQETGMSLALEVARGSGNRVYFSMMRNLLPAVRRCFALVLGHLPGEAQHTLAFLAELATAIEARNADRAAAIVTRFAEHERGRLRAALALQRTPDAGGS